MEFDSGQDGIGPDSAGRAGGNGSFRGPRIDCFGTVFLSQRVLLVALSEIDRQLLQRCLEGKSEAWQAFVDRFVGLVYHVIQQAAQARSVNLSPEDMEDLCSLVFVEILRDDYALLRRFRRKASLATYLAVVARRIVVRQLLRRKARAKTSLPAQVPDDSPPPEERIADREEVQRLLQQLEGTEAEVVRMFHLEGKSYREISSATGIAENSLGPLLARARKRLRQAAEKTN